MRAKTAKQLRHVARAGTIGAPDKEYTTTSTGQVVLTPRCTRAVYRQLKKLRKF